MKRRAARVAALFATAVVAASGLGGSAGAQGASPDGAWDPVQAWPIIPIHAVMTPDGRLLTYGTDQQGRQTGYLAYDVYDPATGTHSTLPNRTATDIFCATQSLVPATGQVLITGGDIYNPADHERPTLNHGSAATAFFDPADDSLTLGSYLTSPRWYATQVVLPDGRILAVGGLDHTGWVGVEVPEIWDPATGRWTELPGAAIPIDDWYYPKLFVMSDGRVFGIGSTRMWVIDPDGARRDPDAWWTWQAGSIVDYGDVRGPGTPRGNIGPRSTAVMYAPGLILQVGGDSAEATVIDIRGRRPVLTPAAPLSANRQWANATVLPDGTVLVTGGAELPDEVTGGFGGVVHRQPELWSPTLDQWRLLPAETEQRMYHSVALLLADGTVLSGGGGAYRLRPGDDPARINRLNIQVFRPGYLFRGDRPVLHQAPDRVAPGTEFTVTATDADRFVLVKLPSVTHSFNNEQRLVPLEVRARDGDTLTLAAPPDTATATPGWYYLFALSAQGVPSTAAIVGFATGPGTR